MREYDYARRHQRWLERVGFRRGDPFEVWDADQERNVLPFLFVERPYLTRIIGDPSRPQSAFLLAGRGAGKTATREMVAYECFHGSIHHRALPVRYTDFSYTLELAGNDVTAVRAEHHVCAIARLIMRALAEDTPATFFELLGDEERVLLGAYVARFADPAVRFKLERRLRGPAPEITLDGMSPVETLAELAHLITQLGLSPSLRYQAVYVLVDRADESAAGLAGALTLLRPLVEEGALLIMPRVAFKFFLSIELGQALTDIVPVRTDKLPLEIITWTDEALKGLLGQRLSYYSEEKFCELKQICKREAHNAADRLVSACDSSPRTLLRLCAEAVRQHVSQTDELFLGPRDITAAIEEFEHDQEILRQTGREGPASVSTPLLETPPPKGLFLDRSDHVWIDGQLVSSPLSPLEFRLLRALYRASPEIMSAEQLIRAVWPESQESDGLEVQDEQNLRKLIARLRKHLEPDGTESAWRFIRNARGRGYWMSKD
ncbi:MAG: winged helix-turn-helix domain-containing protein [Candidatus Hadarchaeum sp.]